MGLIQANTCKLSQDKKVKSIFILLTLWRTENKTFITFGRQVMLCF